MLKRTLLVCLTLCIAFSAEAQSRFRFGFRLNPLISMSSLEDKDNSTIADLNKSGGLRLSTGLMATYGFSEKVGIYTGVMFAFKNFKSSVNHTPEIDLDGVRTKGTQRTITHNAGLNFLEIPVALHLMSNEVTTGMKIRGLFGLSLNTLVGASTERNEYIIDIMNTSSNNIKDLMTNADKVLTTTTPVGAELKTYSDLNKTKKKSGTQGYNIFVPDFLFGAGIDWEIEGVGSFDFGISYHHPIGNVSKYALRGSDKASVRYLSFDLGYYF
jgi:hypothetical protein